VPVPDVVVPAGAPETLQLSVVPVPVNVYDCVRVPFASDAHELPGAGAVGAVGVGVIVTADVTVALTHDVGAEPVTTQLTVNDVAAPGFVNATVTEEFVVAPRVAIPDAPTSAHKYVGEPPAFTRPETFHV
jgi:hypothetical protein